MEGGGTAEVAGSKADMIGSLKVGDDSKRDVLKREDVLRRGVSVADKIKAIILLVWIASMACCKTSPLR